MSSVGTDLSDAGGSDRAAIFIAPSDELACVDRLAVVGRRRCWMRALVLQELRRSRVSALVAPPFAPPPSHAGDAWSARLGKP